MNVMNVESRVMGACYDVKGPKNISGLRRTSHSRYTVGYHYD